MEEIHKIFFEESFEGLDTMESSLLTLDDGADSETINAIFRAAHSIKGGAATFDFVDVSTCTHGVETLLDEMRHRVRPVTPDAVQLLLKSVDVLRHMLESVQGQRNIDAPRIAALNEEIAGALNECKDEKTATRAVATPRLAAGDSESSAASDVASKTEDPTPGLVIDFIPESGILRTNNDPVRMFQELSRLGRIDVIADITAVPTLESLEPDACYMRWEIRFQDAVEQTAVESVFDWVDTISTIHYRRCPIPGAVGPVVGCVEPPVTPGVKAAPPLSVVGGSPPGVPVPLKAAPDGASIRVSTTKLDHLINLVGELVITQSMLSRFADG
jgi:two-component system chemotaxis sensor kinase CheA